MYEEELAGLSKNGAKYLAIGAIAMGLHGYPRATFDLDILPELSPNNLDKIITTLGSLGYVPRLPINPHDLKDPEKRKLWHDEKNMKVFSFIRPHEMRRTIDLMIYSPLPFDACFERRHTIDIAGTPVYVVSLEDLLKLKLIAHREKDERDITVLQRMLERRRDD